MTSTDPTFPARLTLLCCAGTASARGGGFAAPEEGLDAGGVRLAHGFRFAGAKPAAILTSPAMAARQTAEAIGLDAASEPALADIGWGEWQGRSFEDIDPDAFARWLADPTKGVPGGESYAAIIERIAPWLAAIGRSEARTLAITHSMTIRAILSAAIGLPSDVALRIDIAPLSITELSFRGGWRLQALRPS